MTNGDHQLMVSWDNKTYQVSSLAHGTLGSHASADVVLTGTGVALLHAEVWYDDGWGWAITDLNTDPVSWFEGEAFEELPITRGTTVWLGDPVHGAQVRLEPSLTGGSDRSANDNALASITQQRRSRLQGTALHRDPTSPFQSLAAPAPKETSNDPQ